MGGDEKGKGGKPDPKQRAREAINQSPKARELLIQRARELLIPKARELLIPKAKELLKC